MLKWQWRPPRPDDHKAVNPFLTRAAVPTFVPRSLQAARQLEAEAEKAAATTQSLPPFTEATVELASQVHRRQLEKLEAELETNAEAAGTLCLIISLSSQSISTKAR
jgi:hypothetical protein